TFLRRSLIAVLLVVAGVGGLLNKLAKDRAAAHQRLEDQKQIAGLEKSVATANFSQEENTKLFIKSFEDLSKKLADLKGQVMTESLQKQVAMLEAELGHTRKALDIPRAEIQASLGDVGFNLERIERRDTYVEQKPDGTVEFELTVANTSKVQAKDGAI